MWILHTSEGQNIQLHFLDFDIEATYDVVEVRDGAGPNSTLLGEDVLYPESFSASLSSYMCVTLTFYQFILPQLVWLVSGFVCSRPHGQ